MNELESFLRKWEETKDVQALLDAGLTLPAPETVHSYLSALPAEEQAKIRFVLNDVTTAMALHLERMQGEAEEIRGQINQQVQNVNACLSYSNSQRTK